jgi:hypothetical protein
MSPLGVLPTWKGEALKGVKVNKYPPKYQNREVSRGVAVRSDRRSARSDAHLANLLSDGGEPFSCQQVKQRDCRRGSRATYRTRGGESSRLAADRRAPAKGVLALSMSIKQVDEQIAPSGPLSGLAPSWRSVSSKMAIDSRHPPHATNGTRQGEQAVAMELAGDPSIREVREMKLVTYHRRSPKNRSRKHH